MTADIAEKIAHYKLVLENEGVSDSRVLKTLQKLEKYTLNTDLLMKTGIGKTVNKFRRHNEQIAILAKRLVSSWKDLVKLESTIHTEVPSRVKKHHSIESFDDALSVSIPKKKPRLSPKKVQKEITVPPLPIELPEISPDYHPVMKVESRRAQPSNANSVLQDAITSKKSISRMFTGTKRNFAIPSLFELCMKTLIRNIEAIYELGGVPYEIIKPVLKQCSASQLLHIESYNSYLVENTEELWEILCKREFKGECSKKEELESYTELYVRLHEERENRFKRLSAKVSSSMQESRPERKLKLAFVDGPAKPPRGVLRRQIKNGLVSASAYNPSSEVKQTICEQMPPAKTRLTLREQLNAVRAQRPSAHLVAAAPPLMKKTLKQFKKAFY